jgi:hypothetical protein
MPANISLVGGLFWGWKKVTSHPFLKQRVARQKTEDLKKLNLFYRDRIRFADFHTTFTTEAFILVHGICLVVDQFVDIHGTYIDAFSIASAFVFVNRNLPHFLFPPCSLETKK